MADVPPSELMTAEADRLEESRLAALELRITADLRGGRAAQLVPELRRPALRSSAPRGAVGPAAAALDPAGRRAEAVAAYGEARPVITDELGVDPGPELRRLYQRLLAADRPGRTPPTARRGRAARGACGRCGGRAGPSVTGRRCRAAGPRRARPAQREPAPAQLPADIG